MGKFKRGNAHWGQATYQERWLQPPHTEPSSVCTLRLSSFPQVTQAGSGFLTSGSAARDSTHWAIQSTIPSLAPCDPRCHSSFLSGPNSSWHRLRSHKASHWPDRDQNLECNPSIGQHHLPHFAQFSLFVHTGSSYLFLFLPCVCLALL